MCSLSVFQFCENLKLGNFQKSKNEKNWYVMENSFQIIRRTKLTIFTGTKNFSKNGTVKTLQYGIIHAIK